MCRWLNIPLYFRGNAMQHPSHPSVGIGQGCEDLNPDEVLLICLSLSKCCITCWYLPAGFKWQRQLMFRSKLTMHTAFERKDNKDPAAVTAIAVSK